METTIDYEPAGSGECELCGELKALVKWRWSENHKYVKSCHSCQNRKTTESYRYYCPICEDNEYTAVSTSKKIAVRGLRHHIVSVHGSNAWERVKGRYQ